MNLRGRVMQVGSRTIGLVKVFVLLAVSGLTMPRLLAQAAAPLVLPYSITTIGGGSTVCVKSGTTMVVSCSATVHDIVGNGCSANQASYGAPTCTTSGGDIRAIAVDPQGNIVIADTAGNMIRKINPNTGLVTVVAGSLQTTAACTAVGAGTPVDKYGDGCQASDGIANNGTLTYTQNLGKPRGVSVASNGDIYIAGYSDNLVHKVSAATGVMSVVAGLVSCTGTKYTSCSNAQGYTGEGGPATNYQVVNGVPQLSPTGGAELWQPRGVAADSYGNVYIADTGNQSIRVVYQGGTTLANLINVETGATAQVGSIYTIAGNPPRTPGPSTAVPFANPLAIGYSGNGVLASTALFNTPEDVKVDSNGNIFIADGSNHVVRVIYAGGTQVANLIAMENSGAVAQVGYVYTILGGGAIATYTPNTAVLATSINPSYGTGPTSISARKIALDSRGDIFLIDGGFNVVWFLDASTGYMRTIAGIFGSTNTTYPAAPYVNVIGSTGASGSICAGSTDNIGDGCPATQSVFSAGGNGMGIAVDGQDNLYLADPGDARIRKISINSVFAATTSAAPGTQTIDLHLGAGATVTPTIAFPNGNPDFMQTGTANCSANADTTVDCLIGVAFQPTQPGRDSSTLLVSGGPATGASVGLGGTGIVSAVSIDPGSTSLASSTLSTSAQQVAADGGGNLFVADTGNNRILYFPVGGGSSTVIAGGNGSGYSGDNAAATSAKLNGPKGVAVDSAGNVYIADTGNNVIRLVDRVSQKIATLAGGAASVCPLAVDAFGDSCPAALTNFSAPSGIAADANGNIYISDTGHNLIRTIAPNGYSYLYAGGPVCAGATDTSGDGCNAKQATFSSPAGLTVDASSNLYIADSGDNLVRKIAYVTSTVTAVAGNGQAGVGGDGGTATSAQLSGPLGVAVDAAGDVFIADTGNNGLRIVSPASGNISTLVGILGSSGTGTVPGPASKLMLNGPRGVAVTGQGTLSLTDSANTRLLQVQRSSVSYNFGIVGVTTTSDTQLFNLTSSGTSALTLTLPPPSFAGSGKTADLPLVASTSQGCNSATLAVGTTCSMTGQFTPSGASVESATWLFNSNAANSTPPAISLSGTGEILVNSAVVVTQSPSGNPQYGQTVTVTATVTPASTPAPMTGTITFKVDNVANLPIPITYANGVATASTTIGSPAVGVHTVTAVYSGALPYYAAANNNSAPLNITVVKANTTPGLTASTATLLQFSTETLTATVASTTTGTPTGTVSFFNGTALLGTNSLTSGGVATFVSSTLPVGSYKVTSVYNGDGNYATSTSSSTSFTVSADPQDFQLTVSTAAVAIAGGSTVQTTLYVTPTNTLADTLILTCTGLPQYATCTFGPPSTLTVTATTNIQTYWQQPIPVVVTIWSNIAPVASATPAQMPGSKNATTVPAMGWPILLIGIGGLTSFRKRLRRSGVGLCLVLICLLSGASMTLSGCTSSINGVKYTTPAGTSNVTITVKGSNSATRTIPIQYTITGPGF